MASILDFDTCEIKRMSEPETGFIGQECLHRRGIWLQLLKDIQETSTCFQSGQAGSAPVLWFCLVRCEHPFTSVLDLLFVLQQCCISLLSALSLCNTESPGSSWERMWFQIWFHLSSVWTKICITALVQPESCGLKWWWNAAISNSHQWLLLSGSCQGRGAEQGVQGAGVQGPVW